METTRVRDPFPDFAYPEHPVIAAPSPRAVPPVRRASVGRRMLGVLVLLVLTACSVPVHVLAVLFVFVEIESPGDTESAALMIAGCGIASFLALLITASLAQLVGGFPGRWRARITFAALSAILSIAVATLGVVAVVRG